MVVTFWAKMAYINFFDRVLAPALTSMGDAPPDVRPVRFFAPAEDYFAPLKICQKWLQLL